jgi:hypothetical protein
MADAYQEVLASKREGLRRREEAGMGMSEFKATKYPYKEVEARIPELIAVQCRCGHVIKQLRDRFQPGLHVVICLACSNTSSEIELLSGERVAVTAESHRDGADG